MKTQRRSLAHRIPRLMELDQRNELDERAEKRCDRVRPPTFKTPYIPSRVTTTTSGDEEFSIVKVEERCPNEKVNLPTSTSKPMASSSKAPYVIYKSTVLTMNTILIYNAIQVGTYYFGTQNALVT